MSGGRSRRPARSRRQQRPAPPRHHNRRDWGWHPLRAEWATRVVASSPVTASDLTLDLGAGSGALTWPLLEVGAHVIAVELHARRLDELRGLVEGDRPGKLTVVERDLRDLRLPDRPFRVVASPPYAMTNEILRLLMTSDLMRSADLVLQTGAAYGVCERGLRGPHARRYRVGLGLRVPRHAFTRPPGVDTVVLQIRHR